MTILIDSDVLIWYTKGHVKAKARLDFIQPWQISIVTYIELAQGCPIISDRAMHLIDIYAISCGLRLADALIAATAIEHKLTVLTANTKHFGMLSELHLERFIL